MTRIQKIVASLIPFLVLASFYVWKSLHPRPLSTPLSVTFTGWATNAAPRMAPLPRIVVCQGATGVCAMFWVTNSGPRNETLWFDTAQIEQRIDGQWRPFSDSAAFNVTWVSNAIVPIPRWRGVEGRSWFGDYGCLFVVGHPPGLPTNVAWRLQLHCGRDRSVGQLVVQEKLGRDVFERNQEYNVVLSSEVVP
jgi:hypothetical protein